MKKNIYKNDAKKIAYFILVIILFSAISLFHSKSIFNLTNYIYASEPVRINIEYLDSTNFPLIYLYYSTKDNKNNYSNGIFEDNVKIAENNHLQKVWGDINSSHVQSNIVMVIDSSGSMKNSMDNVLNSAKTLINKMDSNDKIQIIDFDSTVKKICDFTNDKDKLINSLSLIKANGGTALYDSIDKALEQIKTKTGLKLVIVLTDGKDENAKGNGPGSEVKFDTLKQNIMNSKIPIYTIGFGNNSDMITLDSIALISHGKSFKTNNPSELSKVYDNIINYVHSLHSFSYITNNGKWDNTEREVILKIEKLNYFHKFLYTAPEAHNWSYCVNNNGFFQANHIALSPDGKYIVDSDLFMLLNNKGERLFVLNNDWSTTDASNVYYSGKYLVYTHGYGYSGELYKIDIANKSIQKFNNNALRKVDGNFHKNYDYKPISLSQNGEFVLFTARKTENDEKLKSYYFILYNINKNKVLWENTFLPSMEDWDEPGNCSISNKGYTIINQDHNLFIIDPSGNPVQKLMWQKTDTRYGNTLISPDNKFFLSRIGDYVVLYTIKGKMIWKKKVECNEKGGNLSISQSSKYFAASGIYGPFVFDIKGNIIFNLYKNNKLNNLNIKYESYNSGNGISILDDGTLIYSLGNRIYYTNIKNMK